MNVSSKYDAPEVAKDSFEDHLFHHLTEITRIGTALSVEKNINKLLEMIVDEAKSLTNADAGTLYIVDKDDQCLQFTILQTDSMNVRMGGTSGVEVNLPSVPLVDKNGEPNHANVSSYVALTGETVNIPDVYDAEGFDFSGMRNYDKSTGYRSKSMLVIALQNHENEIIGVLQLLNAQDFKTGEIIAFSSEYVHLVVSLASQAAVALTNTQLIQNLRELFYAFIKSIAAAIDEKSPYTGGHITRVVDLTMMIAEAINETDQKPFGDITFNEDEMEELRLAAWMHDVGKITTPEIVVDKATKLQTVFDRIEFIEQRFHMIIKSIENKYLRQKIELLSIGEPEKDELDLIEREMNQDIAAVSEDFEFLKSINLASEFMDDEKVERLQSIAANTYTHSDREYPYLTQNEVLNLSIRKGTLTDEERQIIENHAEMTFKMLNELPFPKMLSMVPEYAAGHHEKLDGSGYPRHLTKDQLPLQSRIMAIADIFEALTARDRPYKEPMKLSQAVKILSFLVKDGHIDPDIYNLVVDSKLFLEYAKANMNPDQIDE